MKKISCQDLIYHTANKQSRAKCDSGSVGSQRLIQQNTLSWKVLTCSSRHSSGEYIAKISNFHSVSSTSNKCKPRRPTDSVSFYRAMLCIRGTSHGPVSVCVCVCLSGCLSVTSRCSTKTAKRRITQTTPHDIPGTLVF